MNIKQLTLLLTMLVASQRNRRLHTRKEETIMHPFFENVKDGQILVTKKGETIRAVNPHQNTDDPDKPFIVYDEKQNSYFAEDIDIEQSMLVTNTDKENQEHIVFSKFRIPQEATQVQAVMIYSTDDGKTWSKQIPAEHTMACPDEMQLLTLSGKKSQIKQLSHNLLENTWRDGFNVCLELFVNGQLQETEEAVDLTEEKEDNTNA